MGDLLHEMFELVAVPKNAWIWADRAQYTLTTKSRHRGAQDRLTFWLPRRRHTTV
ncbi:hypothetical protein SAMN05444320_102202 [Streptoalloteichus hindustanus]|uniref:Uncharacterized protein n=1 Tax=Streptoalloteichus hindustanus TaxID=2017 RepID=A0A1M4Y1A6_STRHI|nr:hypothetical protein SAMN05444320_102202 [Streptoalloteichus hindustanus]